MAQISDGFYPSPQESLPHRKRYLIDRFRCFAALRVGANIVLAFLTWMRFATKKVRN
jgi:hypothetical protein